MIRQEYKLKLRQIPDFFSRAQVKRSRYFACFFQINESETQVAVIVPKKSVAKAAARNQLKRQVYRELENLIETKKLKNLDLVVSLHGVAEKLEADQLKSELGRQVNKMVEGLND